MADRRKPYNYLLCVFGNLRFMIEFENSKIVCDWFGHWPSLHDAEVLSINFDRCADKGAPSISAIVHAFQVTPDVDSKGFYKLIKHCLIHFQFDGVEENTLKWFNHQNVIEDIFLGPAKGYNGQDLIGIEFASIYGAQLDFKCLAVKVLSIEPFAPSSGVYA